VRVFEPISRSPGGTEQLAVRPESLAKARIGFLDNLKPGARPLMQRLKVLLAERYPDATFTWHQKIETMIPCPAPAMADLAKCHAVITAVGD
jgi:hypothetical protein